MAARIINLDALIPDAAYVVLDGVQHEIKAATVEMYLKVMKSRERLKNASDEVESLEQAVMMITLACPSIDRARLMQLPLPALTALTDIIQEQMEGKSDDEAGEGADAGE